MSELMFYACQEVDIRDDRLRSRFLKRQLREVLDRTIVVAGKAVAETVDLVRESGTSVRRKSEEIYDNSFVSNLEKSGFLKEIWGE